MSREKISEKMVPDCLQLQGYLTDYKGSPEQYHSSQEDLFWCIKFSTM
jgi:hypothetical protein